jgi:hypothetical protein
VYVQESQVVLQIALPIREQLHHRECTTLCYMAIRVLLDPRGYGELRSPTRNAMLDHFRRLGLAHLRLSQD